MLKKLVHAFFAACALAALSVSPAVAEPAPLVLGEDYALVNPPLLAEDSSKIEVLEFFSYGCPHCKDLNPLIHAWAAKLPADVSFKRLPVSFNRPFYEVLAKLFYTLEATGEIKRLDSVVFSALHDKGVALTTEKNVLDWASSQGVDAKKFSDAFKSFNVGVKTRRADQQATAARIDGVPAVVVDGRYRIIGKNVRDFEEMLALTTRVIEKARAERKAKPAAPAAPAAPAPAPVKAAPAAPAPKK